MLGAQRDLPPPDEPAYIVALGLAPPPYCKEGDEEEARMPWPSFAPIGPTSCVRSVASSSEASQGAASAGNRSAVGAAAWLEDASVKKKEAEDEHPATRAGGCGASQQKAIPGICCSAPDLVRHSEHGDMDAVRALLEAGQDPSRQDDFGFAALHGAAKKGHVEVARLLLQWRADVNSKSHRDETPLHYACKYGHTSVAQLLLDERAELDVVSTAGITPSEQARSKNHKKLADLIVSAACARQKACQLSF